MHTDIEVVFVLPNYDIVFSCRHWCLTLEHGLHVCIRGVCVCVCVCVACAAAFANVCMRGVCV